MSRMGSKSFQYHCRCFGTFIRCDDQTISRVRMDEARFLVKTNLKYFINEACIVVVDGESFRCFLTEDSTSVFNSSSMNLDRVDEEESELSSSSMENDSNGEEVKAHRRAPFPMSRLSH